MTNRVAAEKVVWTLQQAGFEAYLVGGCVRDRLLGWGESAEHDVATSARPDRICELFRRTEQVGAKFGVVLVKLGRQCIEVASFRTDASYTDGRRPDRVRFATLQEDAQRRDFTVNGIYYDPFADRLIDLVGGQADIQARTIRAIGDPDRRFLEDYLRMLRAVRFSAQLDFAIEPATAAAIARHAEHITQISPERILEELRKLLVGKARAVGVRVADELAVLKHILPEVSALHGVAGVSFAEGFDPAASAGDAFEQALAVLTRLPGDCPADVGMAGLLHLVGLGQAQTPTRECGVRKRPKTKDLHLSARLASDVCRRLMCSNRQRSQVVWLVQFLPLFGLGADLELAALKRMMIYGYYEWLRLLYGARVAAGLEPRGALEAVASLADAVDPASLRAATLVNGTDLQEQLSLEPGPAFREILDRLYDAQLNEQIATTDDGLGLARKLACDMGLR